MAKKQLSPLVFEKRVFVGLFMNEGLDFSDTLGLAKKIELDFSKSKALSGIKFTVNAAEAPEDESDPKIKIESVNDSVYFWGNENMLFFASSPSTEEGQLSANYALLMEMIKAPVFKNVLMSGSRTAIYSEAEIGENDKYGQALIKHIFRLPHTDDMPSTASIQYTVDVDERHTTEHRTEVSELDRDNLLELKYGLIHIFRYQDEKGGTIKQLLGDMQQLAPEKEIDDEARRSAEQAVL